MALLKALSHRTLEPNSMHIGCVHTWIRFGAMRIECALNQSTSGGGLEPNSLFIHWITIKSHTVTPPRTATLSKLSLLCRHTRSIRHLRYKLRWPVMLGWYWLDAAKNETTYQVVLCSSSKFTLHVFYYQWQGKGSNWTDFSVCFDTSRMLAR